MERLITVVDRVIGQLAASWLRHRGVVLGRDVKLLGLPAVHRHSTSQVVVGRRALIISKSRYTALGVSHATVLRTLTPEAIIRIGDDVGVSGGSICAAVLVEVGDRTMLGADCLIVDTDFHEVHRVPRRWSKPEPSESDRVTIGCDVFIGARAIILKGTSIGDGAVVGAGAVVTGRVEPGEIVAGNPSRVVGQVGGKRQK